MRYNNTVAVPLCSPHLAALLQTRGLTKQLVLYEGLSILQKNPAK